MAAINTAPVPSTSSKSPDTQNDRGPFAVMIVLFFMWGFMTVFNDILIPRFKEAANTGWVLQAQTNATASGLGTNWFTLPGSPGANQLIVPLDPVGGSVFYRLVHP